MTKKRTRLMCFFSLGDGVRGNSSFYFCRAFGGLLCYLDCSVPSIDTVVVSWFTFELDFSTSKTQALEFAPSNLGQNSVVSGTGQFSYAFVEEAQSSGLRFEHRSGHFLDLFHGSPE